MGNELQAIQAEMSRLEERMSVLEAAAGSGGVSVRDVAELSHRMGALRADLRRLELLSGVGPPDMQKAPGAPPQRVSGYVPRPPVRPIVTPPPVFAFMEKKRRFDEKLFGKYMVGVMASVLVLLAVVVLMTSVWSLIPDVVKFAGIMAVGMALAFAGQRRDKQNGFWLSVSGLGCGICFLDIAGGCFFWDIFPLPIAAFLCMVWFVLVFNVAEKLDSNVFYGIAYIGGLFAVLSAIHLALGLFPGMLCIVMAACVLGVGSVGYQKSRKAALPVMNFLFSFIIAQAMCRQVLFSLYWRELAGGEMMALRAGFFLIGGMALLESARMWPSDGCLSKGKPYMDVLAPGLSLLWFCGSGMELLGPLPDGVVGLTLFSCMAAFCLFHRRVWKSLFPGLVLAGSMVMIVTVPPYLYGFLFPVLALVAAYRLAGCMDVRIRTGMYLLFMFVAGNAGQVYYKETGVPVSMAILIVSGCLGAAVYLYAYVISIKTDSRWRSFEALACIPGFGFTAGRVVHTIIDSMDVTNPDVYAIYPIALLLLYHRWMVMERRDICHNLPHRLIWSVFAVLTYLYLHVAVWFLGWFQPAFGEAAASVLLLAFTCSGLYAAVQSGSVWRSVLAIIMANDALWFCMGGSRNEMFSFLLSLFGLGIAAGFIGFGFWKRRKALRVSGLCMMIVYVLKISLADIQTGGNVAGTAIGLLFGGLVCFGVSFAYNRLDKLYGGDLDREKAHEE